MFVTAVIAVIGLLWVVWPGYGFLIPGALVLDERVAAHFGLSSDAWSRVRHAGGGSDPRDIAETRLAGFAFAIIGVSALVTHAPAMVALVPAVVVVYGAVLSSAARRASRTPRLNLRDVASAAMLGPIGNAVILVCVPTIAARGLAVVVGAVLAVVAFVVAASNADDAASPLEKTLAARRACGLSYTAIGAANVLALGYATLVLHIGSGYAAVLQGWAVISIALLAYSGHARFGALNETLRSAVR
jgi:hypothetical protein